MNEPFPRRTRIAGPRPPAGSEVEGIRLAKQVAAQFIKTRPAQVEPMLDTLVGLSLLRWVETENAYAA